MIDQVDFCIKTYLRPESLARLRRSIDAHYPDAAVAVNNHPDICIGRNQLAQITTRPFILYLDDDFEFTTETIVENLVAEMADPAVGAVGGTVMDCIDQGRTPRHSGGNYLLTDDGGLYLNKRNESKWCDVVPMFCLIRREVMSKCQFRWGIGAEHTDFFMQVKDAGWKACQIEDCKINHHPFTPATQKYKQARWNVGGPIASFMEFWGLNRVVVNGKVIHSLPGAA